MNPPDDQVYAACRTGDVEVFQRLFPDGPTQWRDPRGGSLLHWVVKTPHLPVLDWLLTFPLDVNEPTPSGVAPLTVACGHRQEALVRRLLDHGASVHATDLEGWTVLHWACSCDWVDGVALFLEYGADPEARDRWEHLPEDHLSVNSPHHTALLGLLDAARPGCGLK
jgi:ankyrin repeat protein